MLSLICFLFFAFLSTFCWSYCGATFKINGSNRSGSKVAAAPRLFFLSRIILLCLFGLLALANKNWVNLFYISFGLSLSLSLSLTFAVLCFFLGHSSFISHKNCMDSYAIQSLSTMKSSFFYLVMPSLLVIVCCKMDIVDGSNTNKMKDYCVVVRFILSEWISIVSQEKRNSLWQT